MEAKNDIDLQTYRLVKEAMASYVTKEEFRRFLEFKKAELNRKGKQD